MPDEPTIIRASIRAGTYNLFEGGLAPLDASDVPDALGHPHPDDSRLRKQLGLLSRHNLDLLGIQEATWGIHSHDIVDFVAEELGMSWCYVGRSPFYGCDLAAFVRQSDRLTVEDVVHLPGPPFVHGLLNITLRIAGHPRPVHFLVGHCAPSSPSIRLLEAEMVTVHRHLDMIYVADLNAAATGDSPDTTGLDQYKTAKKLDTRPAKELDAAGFHDTGHVRDDHTPTVGHGPDKLAYRCDRILTTLPAECITGYGVEADCDELSDHRLVWAEFAVGG